ncbi:MAG: efflux RND transporter periplasmic adaptor subunit [Betaproteobacteria bacterium]|nr:efflux RND transporter periplasmic adaptor subunit [Betaproteobacteria bacterium]MDE2423809.1 efflux RND transporter periplasmic adaptor subunit [Betaproteobacteria bacterium]
MFPISKRNIVILIITLLAVLMGIYWLHKPKQNASVITLYGNVDIRQVQSAFYDSGRIVAIKVQEGESVKKGQLLAQLDPTRLQETINQNEALLAAQQQLVTKLVNGSRPEEIEQAKAEVTSAQAGLINAKITYERQASLAKKQYVSKQSVDNALAALDTAKANLNRSQQALKLAIEGPRKEDIKIARHQLESYQAALKLAQQQLVDTNLYAPADAIIENRILEPGDMVSPQSPVLTLALDNPIWVRAYLPETLLGRVHLGMKAEIVSDSFPNQPFKGWVGYISPSAEFTPKNIETPELRTQLVYRVRIYACNPDHRLRLGMPITVHIHQDERPSSINNEPCTP